jgi:hypothetical protein
LYRIEKIPIIPFIIVMLGLLFFIPPSYASDTQTSVKEIERIEYGDNIKTTYFSDGTKLLEVKASVTQKITATTTTSTQTTTLLEPQPTNLLESIKLIFEIIQMSVIIISGILGILGLRLYIRRRKTPDYIRLGQKN